MADCGAGFFPDYSGNHAAWERRTIREVSATTGTIKIEAKAARGTPVGFRYALTFVFPEPAERRIMRHIHELPPTTSAHQPSSR